MSIDKTKFMAVVEAGVKDARSDRSDHIEAELAKLTPAEKVSAFKALRYMASDVERRIGCEHKDYNQKYDWLRMCKTCGAESRLEKVDDTEDMWGPCRQWSAWSYW